jgi:phosphoribosylformylglycinamidine synthase subunit PurS
MIRAQVIVRPRASIFDPQGDAVQRAVQHLGVSAVKQVHVGKFIEIEIDSTDIKATRTQLETVCKDLLSNPVIEDYALTLEPGSGPAVKKPVTVALKKAKTSAARTPAKSAAKKAAKPKKTSKPSVKVPKFKKARKK